VFKVIRSNIQIAITPPRIVRFRSNFVQFDRGKAGLLHMFKAKGQSSRSQRNVTYKQEKRSKTATDRLSEFKLCTGDEIKADRACTASGCLKLQCQSN